MTLYGVEYKIANLPDGANIRYVKEKDGEKTGLLEVYETAESGVYYSAGGFTFRHGDRGIYSVYVDDVFAGAFVVVYVNETKTDMVEEVQVRVSGNYDFAPVDLMGAGYKYEIISRPNTLGGQAPWIDIAGRFVFARQAMPVNISRAGVYVVKAVDDGGDVVAVYQISIR